MIDRKSSVKERTLWAPITFWFRTSMVFQSLRYNGSSIASICRKKPELSAFSALKESEERRQLLLSERIVNSSSSSASASNLSPSTHGTDRDTSPGACPYRVSALSPRPDYQISVQSSLLHTTTTVTDSDVSSTLYCALEEVYALRQTPAWSAFPSLRPNPSVVMVTTAGRMGCRSLPSGLVMSQISSFLLLTEVCPQESLASRDWRCAWPLSKGVSGFLGGLATIQFF